MGKLSNNIISYNESILIEEFLFEGHNNRRLLRGIKRDAKKIKILKTPNADTRSLKKLDKELVYKDTINHIKAVSDVMNELSKEMIKKGIQHDYTKIGEHYDEFFEALSSGLKNEEFYKLPWWKKHSTMERHHLNSHVPEDVNLLDVIEMIVDVSCAGLARTGEVFPTEFDEKMVMKAVENTLKLVQKNIEVVDEELDKKNL